MQHIHCFMKFNVFILLFLILSYSAQAQSVEDKVLEQLNISFEEEGVHLNDLVREYESELMDAGFLESTDLEGWKMLLKEMSSRGFVAHVASGNVALLNIEFQLSLQHFTRAVKNVELADSNAYRTSAIHAFVERYPRPLRSAVPTTSYLWQTVNNADAVLKEHPLYKQLIVLIVANYSFLLDNSSDKILQSETDYSRWIMAFGGHIPSFEERNICQVRIGHNGEIKARRNVVAEMQEIKPVLRDFMTFNRSLSIEETEKYIKDHSYEGYNMPFFSQVSDAEINIEIEKLNAQIDTLEVNSQPYKQSVFMRELWVQKKQFLHASGGQILKEIHRQAHFRIENFTNRQETVDEAMVPLLQVISELRNEECEKVFGESFDTVSQRNNFLLNDHFKQHYLENQFPLYILVNSNRIHSEPPPQEVIVIEKN